MEQVTEYSSETTVKVKPGQVNVWAPAAQPNRTSESIEYVPLKGILQSLGKVHACRISRANYQKAQDRLKRANRDLGETAAFMLALVTTATAIEAVINIADNKIHLSPEYLRMAFDIYMAVFVSVLLVGAFRCWGAIRRRSQAEKEIDQAKKGIFDHCPENQLPASEE